MQSMTRNTAVLTFQQQIIPLQMNEHATYTCVLTYLEVAARLSDNFGNSGGYIQSKTNRHKV